jgi:predicted molibdopterin-dependent oxidoreductase YjgC
LPRLLQSLPNKKFKLLYVFEQDLVKKLGEENAKSFLSRFEYVIYQSANENQTSLLADLVLPSATYAEVEGTFTNFEGRVQKINKAIDPLGNSLPTWQIVANLAGTLGQTCKYVCSEDIFVDLADRVVEFENLSYAKIGDRGAKIAEPAQWVLDRRP